MSEPDMMMYPDGDRRTTRNEPRCSSLSNDKPFIVICATRSDDSQDAAACSIDSSETNSGNAQDAIAIATAVAISFVSIYVPFLLLGQFAKPSFTARIRKAGWGCPGRGHRG